MFTRNNSLRLEAKDKNCSEKKGGKATEACLLQMGGGLPASFIRSRLKPTHARVFDGGGKRIEKNLGTALKKYLGVCFG